jgi:hypothetical protein
VERRAIEPAVVPFRALACLRADRRRVARRGRRASAASDDRPPSWLVVRSTTKRSRVGAHGFTPPPASFGAEPGTLGSSTPHPGFVAVTSNPSRPSHLPPPRSMTRKRLPSSRQALLGSPSPSTHGAWEATCTGASHTPATVDARRSQGASPRLDASWPAGTPLQARDLPPRGPILALLR